MSKPDLYDCEYCDGTGELPKYGWLSEEDGEAINDEWTNCRYCDGDGKVCSSCDLNEERCKSYGQCTTTIDEFLE
jgi:hypothetical protein